jgi:SAM-dependent methyltransferase
MDHDAYRADARIRWEDAAAGWERRNKAMQRSAQPVSMAMVDLLGPQPGHTILELAGGVGETGLLVAELVRPGGKVIITDGAQAMVDAAQRRADELNASNVETRTMEAEWIDLETASVDGVISRWGYMLLADPEAALRETRRVLRRGGRVVLAAWAEPTRNPWLSVLNDTGVELGIAEPTPPDVPSPFAFADPDRIRTLLDAAGFDDDIVVEPVDFTFDYPSLDEYFEHQTDLSTRLKDGLKKLSPADHTRYRDLVDERLSEHVQADSSVKLPARTWVAAATA